MPVLKLNRASKRRSGRIYSVPSLEEIVMIIIMIMIMIMILIMIMIISVWPVLLN